MPAGFSTVACAKPTPNASQSAFTIVPGTDCLSPSPTSYSVNVPFYARPGSSVLLPSNLAFSCVVHGRCGTGTPSCGADQSWTQQATVTFTSSTMLDSNGLYEWTPAVAYSGTAPAPNPAPINGVCGSGGMCAVGNVSGTNTSGLTTTWTCQGLNGSTVNPSCSDIAGSCGGSPQSCATGSASGTSDINGRSTWACVGINGGASASCDMCDSGYVRWTDGSCQKPIAGQCGGGDWSCVLGSVIQQGSSNYTDYWHCSGSYGAPSSSQCSYAIPTQGQCGGSASSCAVGNPYGNSSNSYYNYWYCSGVNGGGSSGQCSSQYCSANWHITSTGPCSVTCGDGTQDVYWADSCGNGNSSTQACNMGACATPINGVCGAAGTCAVGGPGPVTSSSMGFWTTYYWSCSGSNGGTTASCSVRYCTQPAAMVCGGSGI